MILTLFLFVFSPWLGSPAASPVGPLWGRLAWNQIVQETLAPTPVQEEWDQTWQQLARLRDGAVDEQEAQHLRSVLKDKLHAVQAQAKPSPRARILAELLGRSKGEAQHWLTPEELGLREAQELGGFDAQELWLAVEVLTPGQAQVALVLAGLAKWDAIGKQGGQVPAAGKKINLAWKAGVGAARDGRYAEGALPIQRWLHIHYPGSWSATDLALTLSLLGKSDEADLILATEIEREASQEDGQGWVDPELWNRRGLIALGIRHERRARNYLGKAIRLGSTNSAVVLARLDLVQGDLEEARRGFRALSWGPDPGSWTQRGYGLALLPHRPQHQASERQARTQSDQR